MAGWNRICCAGVSVARLALAAPAAAVSADCSWWVTKTVSVNGAGGGSTSWFTRTHVSYYSSWRQLWSWEFGGTKLDLQARP